MCRERERESLAVCASRALRPFADKKISIKNIKKLNIKNIKKYQKIKY